MNTTIEEMRKWFEAMISSTPRLRDNTPLGIMEINGGFSHYMDADTDTLWIGFAYGFRRGAAPAAKCAEALQRLLACPSLSRDELEPETRLAIEQAEDAIAKSNANP